MKRLKDLAAVKRLKVSTSWSEKDTTIAERQMLSMVYDTADYIEIANRNSSKHKGINTYFLLII